MARCARPPRQNITIVHQFLLADNQFIAAELFSSNGSSSSHNGSIIQVQVDWTPQMIALKSEHAFEQPR